MPTTVIRIDPTRTWEAGGFGLGLAIVETEVAFCRGRESGTIASVKFRVQTVAPPSVPAYSKPDA